MKNKTIKDTILMVILICSIFLLLMFHDNKSMEIKEQNQQIELLTCQINDYENGDTVQSLRDQNSIFFLEMNLTKDKNILLERKIEFLLDLIYKIDEEDK